MQLVADRFQFGDFRRDFALERFAFGGKPRGIFRRFCTQTMLQLDLAVLLGKLLSCALQMGGDFVALFGDGGEFPVAGRGEGIKLGLDCIEIASFRREFLLQGVTFGN